MKHKGFTLIELLVVIAIIALLMAIITPALKKAKAAAKSIVCMGNQKNIAPAVLMYSEDYDDLMHGSPNGGLFFYRGTSEPIDPDYRGGSFAEEAYWGVIFNDIYLQNYKMFQCPSARMVDWYKPQGNSFEDAEQYLHATYGINGYYYNDGKRKKMSTFKAPSRLIFAHDHFEHRMDNNPGGGSDTLMLRPAASITLQQWRPVDKGGNANYGGNPDYNVETSPEKEVFRHNNRSNTIYLDGHVDAIQDSDAPEIPVVSNGSYVGNDDRAAASSWY